MPTLNWIGKDKIINHHLDVPYRVLEHQYGFTEKGEQTEPTGSGNMIIHGDNLEALKALLPEYEGKVKCIYIDPPYNTGNENWVYNDNVTDPKIARWLQTVVGKEGEDLSRHDKWLCMMYPRLNLLHKLLHEDGTIFISLDENETIHLRCLMNEIFGEDNFIAQLTLLCNPKGRSQDKYFSTNHEYITIYSKTNRPKDFYSITKDDKLVLKEYKLKDEKGNYRLLELRNTHREFNKENRPNLFYPFYIDINTGNVSLEKNDTFQKEVFPLWPDGYEGCWTWGRELSLKDNHLLKAIKKKDTWKIYRKSYAVSDEGENVKKKLFTIWEDPKFFTEKGQANFGEIFPGLNKNDFPQPKSMDLVAQIIKTCTQDGDIILDSFAGSGTTAHSVLKINNEEHTKRKFILIEMMDYVRDITAERIKRVIKGYGYYEGLHSSFNFYTVSHMLFDNEGKLNDNIDNQHIQKYVYYTETKSALMQNNDSGNPYFLGLYNDTAYYLFYKRGETTTVNHDFLSSIKSKAEQYVIYADNCTLSKEFLTQYHIIFKKISRDIARV